MEKVIRDGKVAILYSPGYGAGWYSWNYDPQMLYDPDTVKWVENGKEGPCPYGERHPDVYCGGASDLEIKWLFEGTAFEIYEYDGAESIRVISDIPFLTA